MSSFFDEEKFRFIADDQGHLYPVHYRELGDKEGSLYSKKVSWADVVIKDVPLEHTFEFEDGISAIESSQDKSETRGHIIVNDRKITQDLQDDDESHSMAANLKWQNRLDRMSPLTYKGAKKDKKKVNYPVKPKTRIESEKQEKEYDMFQELIEKNDHGPMKLNTWRVFPHVTDPCGSFNTPPDTIQFRATGEKTFCPPEHWLTPEVRWDLIWSKMDEIECGYKRSYHYVKAGLKDSSNPGAIDRPNYGPAIYFYDPDSDDLNYDFNYSSDYISGQDYGSSFEKVTPYWEIEGCGTASGTSQVHHERAKQEFINNPTPETFNRYNQRWYVAEEYPMNNSKLRWVKPVHRPQAPMPHL